MGLAMHLYELLACFALIFDRLRGVQLKRPQPFEVSFSAVASFALQPSQYSITGPHSTGVSKPRNGPPPTPQLHVAPPAHWQVPSSLGIGLVRAYLQIDPELAKPSVRAHMEREVTLIAEGEVKKESLVCALMGHWPLQTAYGAARRP